MPDEEGKKKVRKKRMGEERKEPRKWNREMTKRRRKR